MRFANCVPSYHYEPGEEKFPKQKIKSIAEGKYPELPFMGDQIERDWVKAMLPLIKKKSEKFAGHTKYDRNWLLIYDNLSPHADLDSYPDTTGNLGWQLFNQDWQNPFDRVFVLKSDHVWEFSRGADAMKHVIP